MAHLRLGVSGVLPPGTDRKWGGYLEDDKVKILKQDVLFEPPNFIWSLHGGCLKMKEHNENSAKKTFYGIFVSCVYWLDDFYPSSPSSGVICIHHRLPIVEASKNINMFNLKCYSDTHTNISSNYLQGNEIQRGMEGKLSPKRLTEGICVNFDAGLELIDVDRVKHRPPRC